MTHYRCLLAFLLITAIMVPAALRAEGELLSDEQIVVRYFAGGELAKTLTITADGKTEWVVDNGALADKIDKARAFIVKGNTEVPIGGGAAAPTASSVFRIGPGDVLDINVWDNQQISKVVPVRPDGMISLPLLGDVRVGGMTAEQIKSYLQTELKRFVGNPVVTITVTAINSYQVFLQGDVVRPGAYPINGTSTITQAVSLAGGFTAFADPNGIVILRNVDGKTQKIKVKYKRIISGKIADVRVEPGDTIIVP